MGNIFTHSITPEFKKQSVDEFFVQPFFMGEDIKGAITVRTNIKGTERLNKISRPSMITKPKNSIGFNPNGSFSLTHPEIVVKPMAVEFEQNGRAFWDSVLEQLLASGYEMEDVEQMNAPDVYNKIMLPIIAQAGQQDLIRQMFFCNPGAETLSSGIPSGTGDENYNGYNGFHHLFITDLINGTIPTAQNVAIASSVAGVKGAKVLTYTAGSDTSITVTINGVNYTQAYASSAATTVSNWLATHKANIEARAGVNGVVVTSASAAITITSRFKGQAISASATATGGTGTWAASGAVAGTKLGALASNEADTTLNGMLDVAKPELFEFQPVFMITNSMWRNLVKTFKARATELGDTVLKNGMKVPTYEGIPILIRPDWDSWIAAGQNGILPHRAVLTTQANLLFGTDGISDTEKIETWYNPDLQMRRYRVEYMAQTVYLHPELLVLAGFAE